MLLRYAAMPSHPFSLRFLFADVLIRVPSLVVEPFLACSRCYRAWFQDETGVALAVDLYHPHLRCRTTLHRTGCCNTLYAAR